jgi:replicative DNA helicase
LIVVDYLQLLRPENPKEPRYLQVGQSAKRLKELAREANVPVLCLAQLNREVETRKDGRPMLSDLRDSGEIEQDADIVLLLHRLDADDRDPVHRVDLIVAKQRNGPTATVELDYHRAFTRFEERAPA